MAVHGSWPEDSALGLGHREGRAAVGAAARGHQVGPGSGLRPSPTRPRDKGPRGHRRHTVFGITDGSLGSPRSSEQKPWELLR